MSQRSAKSAAELESMIIAELRERIGLAVLYRFGPSRTKPPWQWLSVLSLVIELSPAWWLSNQKARRSVGSL